MLSSSHRRFSVKDSFRDWNELNSGLESYETLEFEQFTSMDGGQKSNIYPDTCTMYG